MSQVGQAPEAVLNPLQEACEELELLEVSILTVHLIIHSEAWRFVVVSLNCLLLLVLPLCILFTQQKLMTIFLLQFLFQKLIDCRYAWFSKSHASVDIMYRWFSICYNHHIGLKTCSDFWSAHDLVHVVYCSIMSWLQRLTIWWLWCMTNWATYTRGRKLQPPSRTISLV